MQRSQHAVCPTREHPAYGNTGRPCAAPAANDGRQSNKSDGADVASSLLPDGSVTLPGRHGRVDPHSFDHPDGCQPSVTVFSIVPRHTG